MTLAQDLAVGGRILARAGTPVPAQSVLERFSVLAVAVSDDWSRGVEPAVPLEDPNRFLELRQAEELVRALVEGVLRNRNQALLPFPYPGYPHWPGVTAALVAAAAALPMGLRLDLVEDAALVALLASGAELPCSLTLRSRGYLAQVTAAEAQELALPSMAPAARAAQAGLRFSRLIFMEGASPEEALEALWADVGRTLSPDVEAGLGAVVLYPPGAEVQLSNGESALVLRHQVSDVRRPLVRLRNGHEVDLLSSYALVIVERKG